MTGGKRTRRELVGFPVGGDGDRFRELLSLERLGVEVYERALHSGGLSGRARTAAEDVKRQEERHVAALAARLGEPAAAARPSLRAGVDRELDRAGVSIDLSALHDERGWLELLAQFERVLAGAYYDALGRLQARTAAGLAATILADEAQHATLLSELLRPDDLSLAVPAAAVPERALNH